MMIISIVIFTLYSALILLFVKGFDALKDCRIPTSAPKTNFSILVPFRNEALNLPQLLQSFKTLDYPKDKIEIILIDDQSTDSSIEVIDEFKENNMDLPILIINNIKVTSSPKKEAIELGVKKASGEWIISTDADCIVPEKWLKAFDHFIHIEPVEMVVAPVSYNIQNHFLEKFQLLDFLSLQGTTMGSFGLKTAFLTRPFLCNGANLCYKKEAFQHIKGFEGNKDITSGDDVFLLEKMLDHYPDKVRFIKSEAAVVRTSAMSSLQKLIQQRVRWASKTASYKHWFGKFVGLLVVTANFWLITLFFLSVFNEFSWTYFGFLFLLKFNIDFILLFKTASFFDQKEVLRSYFLSSLLYPFFTLLVTLLSFRKSYKWKERTYHK